MNIEFKSIRYEDKDILQQFFNVYERTRLYPYYLNYGYLSLNSNGSYKYTIIEMCDDKILLCIKDIKLFTTKYLRLLGFPISLSGNYSNELKVFEYAKNVIGCKNILLKEDELQLLPEEYRIVNDEIEDYDYYSNIEQRVIDIQKRRFRVKYRINKYKKDITFRLANKSDIENLKEIHENWVNFKTQNNIPIRSKKIFKNMFKHIYDYMGEDKDIRIYILYYKEVAMGFTLLNDIGNNNVCQIVQQYYNSSNLPKVSEEDFIDIGKICSDLGEIFYYFLIEQLHKEGYKKAMVAGTGGSKSLLDFKKHIHKSVIKYKLIRFDD